jgi:hypothetical protein
MKYLYSIIRIIASPNTDIQVEIIYYTNYIYYVYYTNYINYCRFFKISDFRTTCGRTKGS